MLSDERRASRGELGMMQIRGSGGLRDFACYVREFKTVMAPSMMSRAASSPILELIIMS